MDHSGHDSGDAAPAGSNWQERRDAIEQCVDQAELAAAAMHDAHPTVRMAAAKRVTDENVLAHVAMEDREAWIQEVAVQRITSQAMLERVAQSGASVKARVAATHRVDSQPALAALAQGSESAAVRVAAIRRLEDPAVLAQLRTDKEALVRLSAADRLSTLGGPAQQPTMPAPVAVEESEGDEAQPFVASQPTAAGTGTDEVGREESDEASDAQPQPAAEPERARGGPHGGSRGIGSLVDLFGQAPVLETPAWLENGEVVGVGAALVAGQVQATEQAARQEAAERAAREAAKQAGQGQVQRRLRADAAVSWRGRRGTLAQQLGIGAPEPGGTARPAAPAIKKDVLKRIDEPMAGLAEIDESEEARAGWRKRLERAEIEVDQQALERMAQTDGHWQVRREATKRLLDDAVLVSIACRDPNWHVRDAAIGRIKDPQHIAMAGLKTECLDVRWRAVNRLRDPVLLMEIAERTSDERLQNVIRNRLSDGGLQKAMEAWLASSQDIERRLRAVDALGGTNPVVRLAATMDGSVLVRKAAVERLEPTDEVFREVFEREIEKSAKADPQVAVAAIERADAAMFEDELAKLVEARRHPAITAAATRALASIERHAPSM